MEVYFLPCLKKKKKKKIKGSSESPVPKIVGLAEFTTSAIPIISSSFDLLFNRYSKIPNITKKYMQPHWYPKGFPSAAYSTNPDTTVQLYHRP